MSYLLAAYGAVLATFTVYAAWLARRRRSLLRELGSVPDLRESNRTQGPPGISS